MRIKGDNARNLTEFLDQHFNADDTYRLGQRFVNIFMDQPWPELFHEPDFKMAVKKITFYLTSLQYYDTMPLTSKRYRKALYLSEQED